MWQAVKNEGNELFKESHFADALEKYNQAIDLNPEVPTYYCNRAFCHTKMENHGLAIEDAGVALEALTLTLSLSLSLSLSLRLSLSLNPNPKPKPKPNPDPHPNAEVALEPEP